MQYCEQKMWIDFSRSMVETFSAKVFWCGYSQIHISLPWKHAKNSIIATSKPEMLLQSNISVKRIDILIKCLEQCFCFILQLQNEKSWLFFGSSNIDRYWNVMYVWRIALSNMFTSRKMCVFTTRGVDGRPKGGPQAHPIFGTKKQVRFQQTHNQGSRQLFLTVSWDLRA